MEEGKEEEFPAFCGCAGLWVLSGLHRGRLTVPVCDLQETQQKGGGGIAEASKGQKWLVCCCCCCRAAKGRHKAPWTSPLESHWEAHSHIRGTDCKSSSPKANTRHGGSGGGRREAQEGKKGTSTFPKRMEMNWKGVGGDQRGQTWDFGGVFLSCYKVCPSPQDILLFFKFYSWVVNRFV